MIFDATVLIGFGTRLLCATRASGGIGRRAGFRCQCPQGRGGSTPPSRTSERCCNPGLKKQFLGYDIALLVAGGVLVGPGDGLLLSSCSREPGTHLSGRWEFAVQIGRASWREGRGVSGSAQLLDG